MKAKSVGVTTKINVFRNYLCGYVYERERSVNDEILLMHTCDLVIVKGGTILIFFRIGMLHSIERESMTVSFQK